MSEMIERVARAIYEARNGPKCVPWAHQVKSHQAPYLADAGAAIEAMREPTATMSRAGQRDLNDNIDAAADTMWRVMGDAALSEDKP